jgi:3-oxoacyl-[acyl-carrier-protein] synthase III
VRGVATLPLDQPLPHDTLKLTTRAAEACLERSAFDRSDIELLLFAGMLRTGYIQEPAIAALIAGELKMNDIIESEQDKKTFTFDVFNGSLGFLNACQVADQLIRAGTFATAMIIASEVEMNAEVFPEDELGVQETASAVILERAPDNGQGFGRFLFRYFTERFDARRLVGRYREGRPFCRLQQDPALEDYYLESIPPVVQELLQSEGLALDQLKAIMPPQLSPRFPARLAEVLGVRTDQLVCCEEADRDLFTSAAPYTLQQALESDRLRSGDVGLIINVSSGIQVGCATYYF